MFVAAGSGKNWMAAIWYAAVCDAICLPRDMQTHWDRSTASLIARDCVHTALCELWNHETYNFRWCAALTTNQLRPNWGRLEFYGANGHHVLRGLRDEDKPLFLSRLCADFGLVVRNEISCLESNGFTIGKSQAIQLPPPIHRIPPRDALILVPHFYVLVLCTCVCL